MKSKKPASSRNQRKPTPTSFDSSSGGAVPRPENPDNDAVKRATQAKNATSARGALQNPDARPKIQFSLVMLQNPQESLVTKIAEVGNKYNKNSEMIHEIITDILRACFYFNVTSIYHIAYIFATIARETTFGYNLVEEKTYPYLSKLYEPVFMGDKLVDNKDLEILILQEHFPFAVLDFIDVITKHNNESIPEYKKAEIRQIINRLKATMAVELFEQFHAILLKAASHQEISNVLFNLIVHYVDVAISKYDDPTSQLFLAGTNNRDSVAVDFLRNIMKQIAGKHLKAENQQSHTTKNNNKQDLEKIIEFAKKLAHADLSADNAINSMTKLQMKIVMLHWLIMRVRKSHGIGNTVIGDGEKYRGRGLVQLTGRGQYTSYVKHLQSPIFSKAIQAIANQDPPDIVTDPDAAKNIGIASVIVVGGLARTGFRKPSLNMSNNKYTNGSTFDFNLAREIVNKDGVDLKSLADPFLTVIQNEIN